MMLANHYGRPALTRISRMPTFPHRPSWVEIDLGQLRRNFAVINHDKPKSVGIISVVKDDAYGHGGVQVAQVALEAGARFLAVGTLEEVSHLREAGINAPILLMGSRQPEEMDACLDFGVTVCVGDWENAVNLSQAAARRGVVAPIHFKINTGMNRYGFRYDTAAEKISEIVKMPGLRGEGIFSHFAMSDELDKSFAYLQRMRYLKVLDGIAQAGIHLPFKHHCNSGGFLDLPDAHWDLVRVGILALGVFPSSVCRRLTGIAPVMTVKSRVSAIQDLLPGDKVGYGMRFTAHEPRRIAVLPIGYGDGLPRVRNEGYVLLHGQRAPLVGGVSMDAITVDITDIPQTKLWDEVVIMGQQGGDRITANDLAALKRSVTYDVLTNWRFRLPRIYKD